MLTPYQMSSVIIAGPINVQEPIIKELHSMKILHIVEHSKNDLADIGKPLESANRLSDLLVRVRALASALGVKKEGTQFELKKGMTEIESITKKLGEELNKNLEEFKAIEEKLSKNQAVKGELEILDGMNIPLEHFTAYNSLAYFMGYIKSKYQPTIRQELQKLTKNFMLFDSLTKKGSFVVLFVDSKFKEQIAGLLQHKGFSPINFQYISNLRGTASSNSKKIEEEISRLQKRNEEIKKNMEKLSQSHGGFLIASEEFLKIQLEKAEAPLMFAATQNSFLIKGWIPADDLSKAINRLNKAGRNKIFVNFEPAKKHDKVPVKLKNPKIVKPFEFFLDLYSTPGYSEIDPTFFVFLTFPILFGIMLGDIGYGILSGIIFLFLKIKMPKAKNFFSILMLASFAAVLFGFFFGEFFGYEIYHPIISREHDIMSLLYLTVAVGVIHVNIGLVLGFINEMKSHGFMHALYAKASWIVLEAGIALLALSYLKIILISPIVGAAFLGLSILMLLKGEGIKGIIELPGIFTNILSYARLMAIGLSSVILAVIINETAGEFFHKGGFMILLGVFILIIGHAINLMLGLLGSFLHSLRLHYIEFFSKFFHGGAKKYQPFGAK